MITIPIDHKDSIIACAVEFRGLKGNQILHMGIDTGATYTIIPVETAILIGTLVQILLTPSEELR